MIVAVARRPGFHAGLGTHLLVTLWFLVAVASGWTLLRRRLPRWASGLAITVLIGVDVAIILFDSVSHLR